MCGIAGYFGREAEHRTAWMTRLLAHRGPDDEGVWASRRSPVALGNRRLKILDLSPLGHQPMASRDQRWMLTFNGEIYNYVELRQDLIARGHVFRSQSDTEVLLAALQEWGTEALVRLKGMFAFALWDEQEGCLLIARDRLGIKPLYYAVKDGTFSFASEITSVLASGVVEPRIDAGALGAFLRLLWVPEPGTLFCGVFKLEPGTFLTWDGAKVSRTRYWDVPTPEPYSSSNDQEAKDRVTDALEAGIRRQLRSDVPVGAFLSGGLDSTTILNLAFSAGASDVRTYSIGFASGDRSLEGALDDLKFARIAAAAAGVKDHREIVLSPDVVSLLPLIVRHLEDPVADPAAINSYLICLAARETSTVLLSGAGGDELFGGYRKYASQSVAERYQQVPAILRKGLVDPIVGRLPVSIGGTGLRSFRFAKKFIRYAGASFFDRFLGYSTYYDAAELEELLGGDPAEAKDPYIGVHPLRDAWDSRDTGQSVDRMTYVDLKYYLPGLGLAYMDKASMAASVEVRVPLIDDDIVNVVARLPDRYKVQGLRTKIILRRVMEGRIPDAILRRPKAPFAAPIRSWLRRDLAPMVAEYLHPGRVLARGLLNPSVVRRLIHEHSRGYEDHSLRIWALLTLEVWMQEFFDRQSRYQMPDHIEQVQLPALAAEVT
jgi:asparagine synthase (glutamine-hydrolysing)